MLYFMGCRYCVFTSVNKLNILQVSVCLFSHIIIRSVCFSKVSSISSKNWHTGVWVYKSTQAQLYHLNLRLCSGGNLQFWRVKPMLKCLKRAFCLMASRGRLLWFYRSLSESESTSHLIYSPSKHCKHEFMVLISSCKSSFIQYEVHLVNYGPI